MTDQLRVFVNEVPTMIAVGAAVWHAVCAYDAALAQQLDDGTAYVTDGRGIRLPLDALVADGTILRVAVSARQDARERNAHS